jgi:hypothetical protein
MKTMTTLQAALGFVMRPSDGRKEAGKHKVVWDASDVGAGVYFVRLEAGEEVRTQKIVLMR